MISVENEWAPLKEVVLGTASAMYWNNPSRMFLKETSPVWLRMFENITGTCFAGRQVPRWITRFYQRELDNFKKILTNHSITVRHPSSVVPLPDEEPGLTQVFARDPVIAVGNRLICGRQKLNVLRKEIRGFQPIFEQLEKENVKVDKTPETKNIFLEGGDILVDLPHVFVGIGNHASNLNGANWLQEKLGKDTRVIPVHITGKGIFHLDTCMTLIGPQKGIICKSVLQNPLPEPLRGYDFIEVDEKTRKELGTNILMVNPDTIIIQKRHRLLKKELEKRGFKVIPLSFTFHALAGGAFRCTTHPLVRK